MNTTLLSWLHALAAQHRVYNAIQIVMGARRLRRQLAAHVQVRSRENYVIDFGGGTGAMLQFLPDACRYVCLDLDPLKLHGFRSRDRGGMAVLGSASLAPFKDNCADYVLAVALCHRLDDALLEDTFREIRRVLKPDGRLVMLDPVLALHCLIGRVLWALDRGSHPRAADSLVAGLSRHLRPVEDARPAIYHEYLITVAVK